MKSTDKKFLTTFLTGSINTFKKIFFISLILTNLNLNAQTLITGKASSYAGDTIKIYTLNDFITLTPKFVANLIVKSNGKFSLYLKTKSTQRIYFELPQVEAFLYIEPNKKYNIRLPKKTKLTIEQKLNPYFRKDAVPAYIVNLDSNDINYKIALFNKYLSNIQTKLLITKKIDKKLSLLDALKNKIDSLKKNSFLYNYEFYNLALLHYYSFHYKPNFYIKTFLEKTPISFNPAYFNFFNTILNNLFSPDNSTLNLKKIAIALEKNNFSQIENAISEKNPNLNKHIVDLLALKGLYDLFYDNDYYQNQIIKTLKNTKNIDSNSLTALIIKNFLKKTTTLRKNYPVPDFALPNYRKKIINLKKFNGDFVYLNFFNPNSTACQEILPFLEKYHKNKIKGLKIVTIYVGNNFQEMKNYLKTHKKYKWTFLFANFNSKIVKDYNIDAYPSFFLINPDGTLAVQHTPSPIGNFEQTYNNAFKQWQKNHLKLRYY
jgi:thiol-disulfide isomerase/thioredoxin